ncbi:hypothetical protein GMLC_33920 [Geomonas limicola]|uniref:Oxygen sensor histidine kinase NreB n=1 Tax=Geomonas limicola TaxID=2740186 RepID=A0A6V8NE14_9BACT|nr:PAS domain S-box protein [Geomonas limicola]GFO69813.1 hypothetical protein GMLC_33920 [Geomonas limicola]
MSSIYRYRSLIVIGFAICNLMVIVLAWHFLQESRNQHEQYAEVVSQNLGKAIDESISGAIEKVDLSLRALVDELEEKPAWDGRRKDQIEGMLASYQRRLPGGEGIDVTDRLGRVVYRSGGVGQRGLDCLGRDFLKLLNEHPDAGLQVSVPLVDPITGHQIIVMARHYHGRDSNFGGMVCSHIRVDHFSKLLAQFDMGASGSITLYSSDLKPIAKFRGAGNGQGHAPGPVPSELASLLRSGVRRATYRSTASGSEQIVTFHRLPVAPLLVTVALASEDYLEQWRNDMVITSLLVGSFLLLSLVSAGAAFQSMSRIGRKNEKLFEVNEHLHQVIDEYQILAEELRESERRYSALFANRLNAIAHCRIVSNEQGQPVDFALLSVNQAYEEILGIRKRDVEGRTIREIYPDFDSFGFDYIGVFGKIAQLGGETQFEAFFEPTQQYLSIYAYSPQPDEFTTIITDVTERKKADEALRVSESKFRIIFDNEVYGIIIFELDTGRIIDVNRSLIRMYGYQREELLSGMLASDLSAERDSSELLVQEIEKSSSTFVPLRYHRKKDGTIFPVEIVGGAYQWNGRRVMFKLVHDISERVKAEEALKRYAQRLIVQEEDLRKEVSRELHDDIGQELTALGLNLAYIGNLLADQTRPDLRSTLEDSRQLTKEISRTVRNLMVELRPSQLEEYGLGGALRSYADQYRQRTGLEVLVDIDENIPRLTPKQEIALFRITQEALNNVAKYALANLVTVTLSREGDLLQLCITDDGQGFVPSTDNLQLTGSGWGLTIMRERAELAGGTLRLSSESGMGTTVLIEIRE